MQCARAAAIFAALVAGVGARAADDRGATASAPSTPDAPLLEEVLVEAPEPRYAAPTLRDRIGRVWAPVKINGKGPFRLVLDTGATSSAIVQSVADRLGLPIATTKKTRLLGATGTAIVPYVEVEAMEVGDLLMTDVRLPIVPDVFGGAEGVLGTQGLLDKRIYIDFRRDVIEIEHSRAQARPPGLSMLRFDVLRSRLASVMLTVGGVRTRAIIDTGAQQTIGNTRLRDALLLRPREVNETQVVGVTLDVMDGHTILTPPIALGGVEIRNLRITFGDMSIFEHWKLTQEPALLIGMDIIGSLETFVIDYKRRELLFRARG
jgi:predicted aspartyl protease